MPPSPPTFSASAPDGPDGPDELDWLDGPDGPDGPDGLDWLDGLEWSDGPDAPSTATNRIPGCCAAPDRTASTCASPTARTTSHRRWTRLLRNGRALSADCGPTTGT
ncbi:hypothetical protein DDQ41_13770 [Streptomyces spongiicola]|uniref:DUF2510 domain-containing protein n=1 Tax=Streptomyces spongiicola TaxID=1690221 RepID=A0ABM6V6Q0_9ACTN|nr:hypothetical protein DDQ41_13770 [Streptomyces spongiicola]